MDRSCERFREKGCFSVAARYPLGEKQPSSRNLEVGHFKQGSSDRMEVTGRPYIFTKRISGRD